MEAKRTWRGWQGHFIRPVWWHLNTLVECGEVMVVVSTVGQLSHGKIGYAADGGRAGEDDWEGLDVLGNTYETMVSPADDSEYHDAVFDFENDPYSHLTRHYKSENEAQAGHYEVLDAVSVLLNRETVEESTKAFDESVPRPPY